MNNHLETLKTFQKWRRGDHELSQTLEDMGVTPKGIGEALDWAISELEASEGDSVEHLKMAAEAEAHALDEANREIKALRVERDQLAARVERLEESIRYAHENQPEYHDQGMGCGLEDRCITDCYEAMRYGWDEAIERVYSECMVPEDLLTEAPAQSLAHIREQLMDAYREGFLDGCIVDENDEDFIDYGASASDAAEAYGSKLREQAK